MSDKTVFHEEHVDERHKGASEYSPFQPDEVLAYHFEALRQTTELGPEKSIMLAVLEDAVACFQKNLFAKSKKARAVFQEAEDWILDDDESTLFSFQNICEILGIDPQWLREGLMEWKRRKLKERSRYRDAA